VIFDSIALPLSRLIRDEAERRAHAVDARQAVVETEARLIATIVELNTRLFLTESLLAEARERLGTLETEVRSTVRGT
jgi:hypothetical protein